MRFEITHEFEAPLDALELAILSPNLIDKVERGLPNVERVKQTTHKLVGRVLERIWNYKPNVKVPAFAQPYVTLDMLAWDERSVYSLDTHSSQWVITPSVKPEWSKYFRASGTYALVSGSNGVTRRVVSGEAELNVPRVMKNLGERVIVAEVKKTFDAEAAILRDLATLV
ncbi:MAG TPA: DUF2505 family protein [Polyangiaceae bacterium]|nr:DUF2505 family protein [Polyangiaceae bacterium]